ncbi:MAG: ABC transporter permease [Casimicrobiaceae bacterium]|nr:ABC transporter permease [Casimicrobiaceae bacterium]
MPYAAWLVSAHALIRGGSWPLLGVLLTLALWWAAASLLAGSSPLAAQFSPQQALDAARELFVRGEVFEHTFLSLRRVLVGLMLALALGVPLGLLIGALPRFRAATTPTFQFLRMISPLSWMPIAVMALGVGEAPVIFLLACAGVWPIALNVAAGVAAIDPAWLSLARSLGANARERIVRVILPATAGHLLTGVRLAIGLIWIVLVPAEMLGVSAGLGYFILDTRDRMAYGELMATVLLIGACGYTLDALARSAHARWSR